MSQSYSSPISLLELNLLIESTLAPERPGTKLAKLLNTPPLTISRALTRLEREGLIIRRAAPEDGRIRRSELTAAGVRTLRAIDLEANRILREMNPAFSSAKLKRLVKLMDAFASALPLPMADSRPSDHPLRPMIRTVTRGLGSLASSVFGAKSISTFEWHVLTAIAQGRGKLRALELCERFGAQRNSASVLLQRLEKRGLIRRTVGDLGDRREKFLAIQPEGTKLLATIARNGAAIFNEAFQALSGDEANELCDLFESFIGVHPQQREVSVPFIIRPVAPGGTRLGIFLGSTPLAEFHAPDVDRVEPQTIAAQLKHLAARQRRRKKTG